MAVVPVYFYTTWLSSGSIFDAHVKSMTTDEDGNARSIKDIDEARMLCEELLSKSRDWGNEVDGTYGVYFLEDGIGE